MTATLEYRLVPKAQYAAGNVRTKLQTAQAAAALNPLFAPNVELLEREQPPRVSLTEIDISFSTPWVPTNLYEAFIEDVLGVSVRVSYTQLNSAWSIAPKGTYTDTLANSSTYGVEWRGCTWEGNPRTYKMTGIDLIEAGMNMKAVVVKRRTEAGCSVRTDPALTANAQDKQQQLLERFLAWLRETPERRQFLEDLYNDTFNSLKLPTYSGSHLTFPEMNPVWRAMLRDYQIDAIYQGMLGNAGIFLPVGFGKTAVACGIAMERRRIDPRLKPVIIVKKATLVQFGRTLREIYPNANILVASVEDCCKGKRELFMSRIASNNYDAVVLTHQAFTSLPLRPQTQRDYIQPILDEVEAELERREEEDAENTGVWKKRKSYIVKNLERLRNRLQLKLDRLNKKKNPGLCFEDLGLNLIIADEADCYLNCPFLTKLQSISGLNQSTSDIATDFDWKTTWLRRFYGLGRLILMTGTPIRNTMANLYIMQHFLQPEELDARGIHSFDAWVSMFAKVRCGAEVTITGNLKRTSRLAEFVNLPELLQMFFSVSLIKRYEDVAGENFKRPEAKYVNVLAEMNAEQLEIMDELIRRAEDIKQDMPRIVPAYGPDGERIRDKDGTPINKVDNLLWVSTDGRKAVTDHRLNRPEALNDPKSKVNRCIRRTFKIWKRTASRRSTQIIFLDLSTPKSKSPFSVYRWIRNELIGMGVPHWEIAFVQDCKNDDEKADLFEKVNRGEVRIVLGSTQMLGVGVNVQKKLIALHHLDCTWRPCDLEQREGRILRPGNENDRVLIYRYATSGISGNCSFDSFMWQCVEAKSRFIRQILSGDMSIRKLEEDSSKDPTFQAGQIKALAMGDERLMRHVEVEANLERIKQLARAIDSDIDRLLNGRHNSLPWYRYRIRELTKFLNEAAPDFAFVRQKASTCTGEAFKIRILKKNYTDRHEAGKLLVDLSLQCRADREHFEDWRLIGKYGEFEILMMAPHDQKALVSLRGPSQVWPVQFVVDPDKAIARIEQTYLDVLHEEAEAHRNIERNTENIRRFTAELEQKQVRLTEIRASIASLTIEKAELEQALGINQGDELATMQFDEDDEAA